MCCTLAHPCGPLTVDTTSIQDTNGAARRLTCPCGHSHWQALERPPEEPLVPPVKWKRERVRR